VSSSRIDPVALPPIVNGSLATILVTLTGCPLNASNLEACSK